MRIINLKVAGDKKNTAGEKVHGIYSIYEGVSFRGGSWVAEFANRENQKIFGGLKIHKDFFATRWRFWLCY